MPVLTRSGLNWTPVRADCRSAHRPEGPHGYLDGVIAVLDQDGVSSSAALQDGLSGGQGARLTYHVFDLVRLDDRDLTSCPDRASTRSE